MADWSLYVASEVTDRAGIGAWDGAIPMLFVPMTRDEIMHHPAPDSYIGMLGAPGRNGRPVLLILNVTPADLPRLHMENGTPRLRIRDIQNILRARARQAGAPIVDNLHENARKVAADRAQLDARAAAERARLKQVELDFPGSF